jgi:hypothetical protein
MLKQIKICFVGKRYIPEGEKYEKSVCYGRGLGIAANGLH